MAKSERNAHDFYATPQPAADAICARLFQMYPNPDYIIEPSAGNGNFVRAARKYWPEHFILANEIRSEERNNCLEAGASAFQDEDWIDLVKELDPYRRPLVLGNPPFIAAMSHVMEGMDWLLPRSTIAFFLKDNFLGSHERLLLWKQRQHKHLIPIIPRPSFKTTEKASNDTNEYSVFIWEIGYKGKATVEDHIVWRLPRGVRAT